VDSLVDKIRFLHNHNTYKFLTKYYRMPSIIDILGPPVPLFNTISVNLKKLGIDISTYEKDNICYRPPTIERHQDLKNQILGIAELIDKSDVGGRPFTVFKLNEPMVYRGSSISTLKLPEPHPDKPKPQGFDHFECVINVSLEEFMAMYKGVQFETGAMHKEVNPDISLKFGNYAVKFHEQTLLSTFDK